MWTTLAKCSLPAMWSGSIARGLVNSSKAKGGTLLNGFLKSQQRGTTILAVRKGDTVCLAGDGQVSQGSTILKPNAKKIRKVGRDTYLGFAGSTADCFALAECFEAKLEEYSGQTMRAAVAMAKQWRTDRYLRHLEAVMVVVDSQVTLEVTGNGDVLESADGVLGIGSGGGFATAAARALITIEELSAEKVVRRSMAIASDMCCYTNSRFIVHTLPSEPRDLASVKD